MRPECVQLEQHLHDYIEGWLAESERSEVEQHLRACPECQRKVVGWVRIGDALRNLPTLPAPSARKMALPSYPVLPVRWMVGLSFALSVPSAFVLKRLLALGALERLETFTPYPALSMLSQKVMSLAQSLWQQIQQGVIG